MEKDSELPVKKQCELLGISRSKVYYVAEEPKKEDLEREGFIKSRIDYWHMGVRRLKNKLNREDGTETGRKLMKRYMEEMGIRCVTPSRTCPSGGVNPRYFRTFCAIRTSS